jgi:hypothetical protein
MTIMAKKKIPDLVKALLVFTVVILIMVLAKVIFKIQ